MKTKSINAMALIRLYGLKANARRRAITDRAGGGGPSPYRHAMKSLNDHLHEGVSLQEAQNALEQINDTDLSEQSVDIFLRSLHFLQNFKGIPITPLEGSFWSPDNVFEIAAKSHIALETPSEIISVQFWNNKTADFYSLPAQIAHLLYSDAIPGDLFKQTRFVFHNLRTGKTYECEDVSNEARRARRELIFEIERLLRPTPFTRPPRDAEDEDRKRSA